jgi:hypothetical protein
MRQEPVVRTDPGNADEPIGTEPAEERRLEEDAR